MITTHSPIFIDVSKPHTTIIRVEMSNDGHTKTFSTDKVGFDENERKRLQMIRSCHPTVNEFFFADKIYLVEGETELAVLSYFRDKIGENNIQIVNCFGKANIPMFQRILNQFGVNYIVIHDIDSPKCKRKDSWISNPIWKINETIFNESKVSDNNIVISNFPDFEGQYFGYLQKGDKPYNALIEVSTENFHQSNSYSEIIGLFNNDKPVNHKRKILNVDDFQKIVNENIDLDKVEEPLKWFFD
jgi:putative ATP-dependent endonuclease of OLD family